MHRAGITLGLFCVLSAPAARAAGPSAVAPGSPPSFEEYLNDLTSENGPDRLFAARELRRKVRAATRISGRRDGASLAVSEALIQLEGYDQLLAPRCIMALDRDNVRGACADILRLLETADALPALEQARSAEHRRRVVRKLDKAIDVIRAQLPAQTSPSAP